MNEVQFDDRDHLSVVGDLVPVPTRTPARFIAAPPKPLKGEVVRANQL